MRETADKVVITKQLAEVIHDERHQSYVLLDLIML